MHLGIIAQVVFDVVYMIYGLVVFTTVVSIILPTIKVDSVLVNSIQYTVQIIVECCHQHGKR